MDIKKQIFIDKYIAKPFAYSLNFFVRLLGKILRINHNLNREFKTIAICKFKGMGSIIQSTPMIDVIRNRFPDAEIIFISTETNRSFLEKIDWIDTIITVDDRNFFQFIRSNIQSLFRLIRIRPQVYIDLEIYSDYSTLFTLFSLSTNRLGFYLRSSTYRMGIYTHMMFYNPRISISKIYLQMAELIGADTKNAKMYTLQSDANLSEKFDAKQLGSKYIVINPNASDLRLERRWSDDKFISLIKLILSDYSEVKVVLIGSKGEYAYTKEIEKKVDDIRLINTAGSTNLNELIGIVSNADIMISNDTGPMHIAYSVQIPVICLFGPCSPDQYGMKTFAHIIYKKVYCSPCVHDFEIPPCKGDNICMQLITVKEVYDAFSALYKNPELLQNQNQYENIYKNKDKVLGMFNR